MAVYFFPAIFSCMGGGMEEQNSFKYLLSERAPALPSPLSPKLRLGRGEGGGGQEARGDSAPNARADNGAGAAG